ncbi:MAG: VOC family protein [Candidatus Hydrogenedentes bacterium]|nr:VOC family protein [Candidatus Hydrogenedentota bacterium]
MAPKAKSIPMGYHTVTPSVIVNSAARALEFYQRAFGAVELYRLVEPGGKIGHAEIQIGDSIVMLSDEYPDFGFNSPKTLGGSPVSLLVYVEDADAVFAQAIAAGATERGPVTDQFWGDRSGAVEDPFGHVWNIAAHREDLSPAEMQTRFTALLAEHG